MTAIEHLEEVHKFCGEQITCYGCKYHDDDKGQCKWNTIFHSHPYTWEVDDLKEVLKER